MSDETAQSFRIRTFGGDQTVTLELGLPIFILGANGTGKSALVHDLVVQKSGSAEYIPGSRPNFFQGEALSLTPATRAQVRTSKPSWDVQPVMRWNPTAGFERNESAIHDIQGAELQFKVNAADRIAVEGKDSASIATLQAGNSPLDRLNHLLAAATLPIRAVLVNSELRVKREGATYSYARSSDGERSALFIISVVLSAAPGTIFIIDEPELHLHRSIVVPLLAGLIRERPDCYFLISTHELELPTVIESAAVIAVRGCRWTGETVESWDVDLLPASAEIPEDLRVDVLGSRRRILFVEGENSSLDQPLYALLFPKASVRHKNGCKEVRRAVVGLRATLAEHTVEPFGLVDNDQMSTTEKAELEAEGVYALNVFTVESLYYSSEVRNALAIRQADTLGLDASELLKNAIDRSIESLRRGETLSHLAARVAERTLRGKVLGSIPDRQTIIGNTTPTMTLSFPSPYPEERVKLEGLVAASSLDPIIDRYPVRESGVLTQIANALRFSTRSDYERAALARIEVDAELAEALRVKLEPLAANLVV